MHRFFTINDVVKNAFVRLSDYALMCLIEALHEDVAEGVAGSRETLQICQGIIRDRNRRDFQSLPASLYLEAEGGETRK